MEVSGKIEIPILIYNEMRDAIKKDNEKIAELSKKVAILEDENKELTETLDDITNSSIIERLFKWGRLIKVKKKQ